MTTVYVVSAGPLTHKIGVARNPYARVMDLQIGNPTRLCVAFSAELNNAHEIEQRAHARLSHLRLTGEWFACGAECAVSAIQWHLYT